MNYKDTDLSRACFESSRSSLDLYRHLKTYCSTSIACLLVTPNTLLSCSWSREKTRTTTYPSHPTCYFTIFLLIYFIPKGQEPNFYLSSDGSLCVCYDCPAPLLTPSSPAISFRISTDCSGQRPRWGSQNSFLYRQYQI